MRKAIEDGGIPNSDQHKWEQGTRANTSNKKGNWKIGHSETRNKKLAAQSTHGRASWNEDSYRMALLSSPQKIGVLNASTGQQWLSRGQCAKHYGVTDSTICRWIKNGKNNLTDL